MKLTAFKDRSLSYGTLKPEQIMQNIHEAICNEGYSLEKLCEFCKEYEEIKKSCPMMDIKEIRESLIIVQVFKYLDSLSPEGYYFGANKCNENNFGYWKIKEEL